MKHAFITTLLVGFFALLIPLQSQIAPAPGVGTDITISGTLTAGTVTSSGAVNGGSAAITGGGSILLNSGSNGGRIYPGGAAGVFRFTDTNASGGAIFEGIEISDPAAPAANEGRLYFRDNGSG